jgi:hypothetical protein
MKRINDDADFEIIAGRKCLRDGKRYRSGGLTMMDSSTTMDGYQRMLDGRPARITGGSGDPLGCHKPGWRVFDFDDAAANDAKAEARRRYEQELCDAWRGDAGNEGMVEGAACICATLNIPTTRVCPAMCAGLAAGSYVCWMLRGP